MLSSPHAAPSPSSFSRSDASTSFMLVLTSLRRLEVRRRSGGVTPSGSDIGSSPHSGEWGYVAATVVGVLSCLVHRDGLEHSPRQLPQIRGTLHNLRQRRQCLPTFTERGHHLGNPPGSFPRGRLRRLG